LTGGPQTNIPGGPLRRRQVLILAVATEGGLAVLAWVLGWLLNQPVLATLRWDLRDACLGVASSLPMLLGFILCVRWPVGPLAEIKAFAEQVIRPLFTPLSWPEVAVVCLLAGLGEEMLFRGVLQGVFSRWLGAAAGLVLASVLFGLLHPMTWAYALLATLLGLYLGGVWIATDNLLTVVVAHAVYDFVALVYFLSVPSVAVPDESAGGVEGTG
jgi:membrane protease YdiL (CAAX protease family)